MPQSSALFLLTAVSQTTIAQRQMQLIIPTIQVELNEFCDYDGNERDGGGIRVCKQSNECVRLDQTETVGICRTSALDCIDLDAVDLCFDGQICTQANGPNQTGRCGGDNGATCNDQLVCGLNRECNNSICVCESEIKTCPDGSSLLRTGTNCEYIPCPTNGSQGGGGSNTGGSQGSGDSNSGGSNTGGSQGGVSSNTVDSNSDGSNSDGSQVDGSGTDGTLLPCTTDKECNDSGTCTDGACVCNTGFEEPYCTGSKKVEGTVLTCATDAGCNNKGTCTDGACVCNDGLEKPYCTSKNPDSSDTPRSGMKTTMVLVAISMVMMLL